VPSSRPRSGVIIRDAIDDDHRNLAPSDGLPQGVEAGTAQRPSRPTGVGEHAGDLPAACVTERAARGLLGLQRPAILRLSVRRNSDVHGCSILGRRPGRSLPSTLSRLGDVGEVHKVLLDRSSLSGSVRLGSTEADHVPYATIPRPA
jgi:hypothetical protein